MPGETVSTPAPDPTRAFGDDDARWAAFAAADAAADGLFVAAVRTTGIYCRPSCPAKRAKRANVQFYATGAAAEAAGYRACLRCRPDAASRETVRAEAVARACRLIAASETPPALAQLAAAVGLSPHHFHRVFKAVTGVTPRAYAAAHRAGRVGDALRGAGTVTEAVYAAGYNAPSRFYAEAGARLGMSPAAYRAGGAGAAIRYALAAWSLGAILVATTDRGVCAITLGDEPDALVRDLHERFGQADLAGDDPGFAALVAAVVRLAEAPGTPADLPLDIAGTAFQQRVWEALRRIPAGTTASYAEVARAIGAPGAVRAVARACGANPVALAVPCHRVVRADGALSGYRWGVARKRALLDREGTEPDPA